MECVPSGVHGGDLSSYPTATCRALVDICTQSSGRRAKGAGTRQWVQREPWVKALNPHQL